jgi:hypothetical protein
MAVLSQARAKAMPLNQFMAQFLKMVPPGTRRAKEALAEFKKRGK